MIASVRVDNLSYYQAPEGQLGLSVHLNCLDAAGQPIPTLGSRLNERTLQRAPEWHADWEGFQARLLALGQALLAERDEYYAGPAEIVLMESTRYGEGGQGIHVRCVRPGDPFEASLLFERRGTGPMRLNQKRDVTDPATVSRIEAAIDDLFADVEGVMGRMVAARRIQRRGGSHGTAIDS